jgi:WD40-like Beta Propeller Repeat
MVLRGDIYVLLANGDVRRLTHTGNASSPALSPDGRFVAYIGSRHTSTGLPAAPFAIWVAATASRARHVPYKVSAESSVLGRADVALAWAPDSTRLAYRAGNIIIVRLLAGTRSAVILRSVAGFVFAAGTISWSPNGHQLAVPLVPLVVKTTPPVVQVGIYDFTARLWTRTTARFPPGALGKWPGGLTRSSAGFDLAWTRDGQGFLFGTYFSGEGGSRLSGIWRADVHGGIAYLVAGTAAAVRDGTVAPSSPLFEATHWALSPDRRLIATDPASGLWVAGARGKGGRFMHVPMPKSCVLAAYDWLRDSRGLAYVRMCTVPGRLDVRSSLYSRQLASGTARLIMRTQSGEQFPIAIGIGVRRCVFCGA